MPFNAGTLVATIRLDGSDQFDRDLDRNGRSLSTADKIAAKLGATASAVFKGASVATVGATVAATAYVASLFRTGVAYNTLQQQSRAALSTLLGGTTAANAQMDKLDAFAKNSPFAKSVFITAQQQLLGFGVEAKKVIPTLQAVQDAVAAVGGSNEQVSQITYALAQMRGQGKLTGETLNQLGQFGIDAATLIGSKMGKTGAEIRDMASSPGGIPADKVWDPLVSALQEKFAGAAANVKATYTGTLDRIKAASRDIGAALAEPFVGKNKGGLFVTWGNQVADVLRAVESKTYPVVALLQQRALPTFVAITNTLDRARVVVKSWDASSLNSTFETIGQYGPAIAGVSASVLAVASSTLKTIPVLGRFIPALNPVVAGLLAVAATSPEIRAAGSELIGTFQPLTVVAADLARVIAGDVNAVLPVVASGIRTVSDVAKPLVQIVAGIPAPVLLGVAAFVALHKATKDIGADSGQLNTSLMRVTGQAKSFGETWQQSTVFVADASGEIVATSGKAAAMVPVLDRVKGSIVGVGTSIKAAFLSNPVGIALSVISFAVGIWAAANSVAQEKVEEHKKAVADLKGTLDQTTGAVTAATRSAIAENLVKDGTIDKLKKVAISSVEYTDAMLGQIPALNRVRSALKDGIAEQAKSVTGSETAANLAKQLGISTETLTQALLGNVGANAEVSDAVRTSGIDNRAYAETMGRLKYEIDNLDPTAKELLSTLNSQQKKLKEAKDQQDAYNEAMRKASAAMTDAERSNARLNDAIAIARDVSKDAATRLAALKQALDELKGGATTQAEATRDLNEQINNLGDAFEQTDDKGTKLAKSLVDASGNIDTTTAAGRSLFDQVGKLNDQMLTQQQLVYDSAIANGKTLPEAYQAAVDAAGPYQKALYDAGHQAGLSDGQIAGITGKLLAIPAVTAYVLTDNGTVDLNKQAVIQLAEKILATPNKTLEVDAPTIEPIRKQLIDLGVEVSKPKDGKVTVSAVGIQSITDAINHLVRPRSIEITQHITGSLKGGYANGGILGPYGQMFANGGITPAANGLARVPMIAKGGSNILWAEPETIEEAYISRKPGMESRNISILRQAAAWFGQQIIPVGPARPTQRFADGGTAGVNAQQFTVPHSSLANASVKQSTPSVEVNIINPVVKDLVQEARDLGGLIGQGLR